MLARHHGWLTWNHFFRIGNPELNLNLHLSLASYPGWRSWMFFVGLKAMIFNRQYKGMREKNPVLVGGGCRSPQDVHSELETISFLADFSSSIGHLVRQLPMFRFHVSFFRRGCVSLDLQRRPWMILTLEMFLAILKEELRCLRCVDGNILILDIMDCSITVSLLHPSPNLELYTLPGKKKHT